MSLRSSTFLVLAALALGDLRLEAASTNAPQGSSVRLKATPGKRIQATETGSSEVVTNLNRLNVPRDNLMDLEEELYQPLKDLSPKSSLDGAIVPQVYSTRAAALQKLHAKEMLERQKNLMWMSPEDLNSGTTAEEIFKVPEYDKDGLPVKKRSPFENYFQNMGREKVENGKSDRSRDWYNRDKYNKDKYGQDRQNDNQGEGDSSEDSKLPSGLVKREQELRKWIQQDSGSSIAIPQPRNAFSDFFGSGDKLPSEEDRLDHQKKILDEYHAIIDPSWQPPSTTFSLPGRDAARPGRALGALDGLSVLPKRDALMPGAASALAPVLPTALPEPAFKAANAYTAPMPKVEIPKIAPPRPDFNAPRRQF